MAQPQPQQGCHLANAGSMVSALVERQWPKVSFERFEHHCPEFWQGFQRSGIDLVEPAVEILRQRPALNDKGAGDLQPVAVLANRVDKLIHAVAQVLVHAVNRTSFAT